MAIISEDFKKLDLNEFPYDREHTALGEYHCLKPQGKYGSWYDPIPLHQWRSLGGSWMITESEGKRYLEQNRGDNTKDAFKNVYCCLVHESKAYADFTLSFNLRVFEYKNFCGMAFAYKTSRRFMAIGIKESSLMIIKREQEDIQTIASYPIEYDDQRTYTIYIKLEKGMAYVRLDGKIVLTINIEMDYPVSLACVAKSACRYSDIAADTSGLALGQAIKGYDKEQVALEIKRAQYPDLECIKKIDLKNFGSGRQLRIARTEGKTILVLAQHQKRMIRDSFAHLSSLTAFDIDGNVLWTKGEPNNCPDNTLISCDLPFQISDINNDGKLEIIYSVDFEVIIADLLTGEVIKKMPTPIINNDPLVKNEPFYRLNVDAIRVADFSGLGYQSDFIIKDRYQNVWAYNYNFELLWRYHHKNTGHFPYIWDFDNDGKDEMLVGYDLIDHDGKMLWSLPMDTDHTDEIIYAKLHKDLPHQLILASGNEGMNICNMDGTVAVHNEIGHAQRISVALYNPESDGLSIMATSFWGGDGIISIYDYNGKLCHEIEQRSNGNLISPVNYDGKHVLALLNAGPDGGLIDHELDKVVLFPDDGHPTLTAEVFDIDGDGADEIIVWDLSRMWIYKSSYVYKKVDYEKYPDNAFSNYRGEYLIPKD